MLIRIAGHFINNPNHIDKLICIKGLPEEWIVRKTIHGKELVAPWQPDIEANIPMSIRHLCEPLELTKIFPPVYAGRESVVDHFTAIGLKFDFMTQGGQDLWEKITRYVDRIYPRDQRIPEPVIVAPNQKSEFNPHLGRRSVRGSLELVPAEIPVIDLRPTEAELVLANTNPIVTPTEPMILKESVKPPIEKILYRCATPGCEKVYDREQALRMHQIHERRKKQNLEAASAA